jgi:transcriptional regulator with XRE-family HTH domain
MTQSIGQQIENLRDKLKLNQSDFAALLRTTSMSVSRWERDVNLPESRMLLKLGLLAREAGVYAWGFWQEAGLTRAEARAALAPAETREAGADLHTTRSFHRK